MQDFQGIYSFDNYKYVLNNGLYTNVFNDVFDFPTLIAQIDIFYSDFNVQKYGDLADANRPTI